MKKLVTIVLVGFSCISLMGASIWEGAAAMAVGGELPESGYYIATNSFPRNTLVDVVNLENGKTLRAIVVGGIDTPGLLGLLSKEAAISLGIEKGMVGRIRVNMPADPIAFSRYTEGLTTTGDPDRDPEAALSLVETDEVKTTEVPAMPVAETEPIPTQESSPETTENTETVDTEPAEAVTEEQSQVQEPQVPVAPEAEEAVTLEQYVAQEESITELPDMVEPETVAEVPPVVAVTEEVSTEEPVVPETLVFAETVSPAEPAQPVIETTTPEPPAPPVADTPPEGSVELVLEPAEARPPVVAETVPEPMPTEEGLPIQGEPEPVAMVEEAVPEAVPTETPEPVREATLPVAEPTPLVPASPVQAEPIPVEPAPEGGMVKFSVPMVTTLEKGKYYVQLGAFTKTDSVEGLIKKLNGKYPLLVQLGGTGEKPLYRLMIGPLNQGESGALVSYFKKSGYRDAFVKHEI